MENRHPEALILVNDRPSAIGDDLYQWALDAEDMIRRLHARVEELEKDRGNAKRLVSKIWNQHPEARDTIEKATGAWLVFGQDVETSVSAQRVTQAEAQQPTTGEPVLIVEKEPDYWASGHFYEGNKPHINPTKVWHLPIGTKLYTHPAPSVLDDVVRDAELLDWLEGEVCDSYTGVTITRVDHREDGMIIERGFRLRRFHKDYEVKPTLRAAIAAAKGE